MKTKMLTKARSFGTRATRAWTGATSGPAYLRLGDGERPRIRYRMSDILAYERRAKEGV